MNVPAKYPAVSKGDTISIAFAPVEAGRHKDIDIPLVLDLDLYDDVIGIEALNFRSFGGPSVLAGFDYSAVEKAGMRLSYDEEVDALFLKLDEGRSIRQRSVTGKLCVDSRGRMTKIEAALT